MNSEDWVKRFLKYCDDNKIEPWKHDFKNFYTNDNDESSSLELWLKYRLDELDDPQLDNEINKKLGDVFTDLRRSKQQKDPDKVGFPIYDVLNWQKEITDVGRGDSMNSFKTTFTKDIVSSENYKKVYKLIGIDAEEKLDEQYDVLLKDKNYLQFQIIKDNNVEIEEFARLTHSIGNFTVLPYKINTTRGTSKDFRDYWDITLKVIYDLFMSIGDEGIVAWKTFVKKYFLQPFVKSDNTYSVGELWVQHFNKSVYPIEDEDFKQFYHNVNLLIEERGKWITKQLCDKLELQDLNFYNKLKDMKEIKFFDEIEEIIK